MQRLEAKKVNGHTYYYFSNWGWINGKCRRLSQTYLGKAENIAQAMQGVGPAPLFAQVLDWGLPMALWQEATRALVCQQVDQLCPKRDQGLSTGDYIRLAAINRACDPVSKQAMWNWLSHTCLPRLWPQASAQQLTSQRFWDHMDRIDSATAQAAWQQLIAQVLEREQIELSQICFDGTNFYTFIDRLQLPYVGSVKLDEHADLMGVSNQDARWQTASDPGLEGTKSWRTQQVVYGQERTLVMTYNENLFSSQWATVQNDLTHALGQLGALRQNLKNRADGLIKGGVKPSVESVKSKCHQILHRQHLRQLVEITVTENSEGMPQLAYQAPADKQQKMADTYLGKTLLITSHKDWSDAQVIRAYRSQFLIEEIFHEMKDRHIGTWWPLRHWTDSKIQVHGLYCTIALMLRALIWRRAQKAGLQMSMATLLEKLGQIQQVINVYPAKRAGQSPAEQAVLTKRDEVQEKLIEILGLQTPKPTI